MRTVRTESFSALAFGERISTLCRQSGVAIERTNLRPRVLFPPTPIPQKLPS